MENIHVFVAVSEDYNIKMKAATTGHENFAFQRQFKIHLTTDTM